jgi:cytochrome oxidase assembly protein ShyY1
LTLHRWLAPRLLGLHALAVVAIAGCVLMGLWQLGVYGSRHEDAAKVARQAAPVDLLAVWGPDDPFTPDLTERQVLVRGEFTGDQFLVRRGADRYWVVAPLRVEGTKSMLLVVRGWTDKPLAAPARPGGTVAFRAILQPGEDGSDANAVDPTTGGTSRLRGSIYGSVSIPQLANVVHGDLFSGFALTRAAGINAGLRPVDPPDPHVSWTVGLRNLAYALQWWVFGLFAGFMWWRMANDLVDVEGRLNEADSLTR